MLALATTGLAAGWVGSFKAARAVTLTGAFQRRFGRRFRGQLFRHAGRRLRLHTLVFAQRHGIRLGDAQVARTLAGERNVSYTV